MVGPFCAPTSSTATEAEAVTRRPHACVERPVLSLKKARNLLRASHSIWSGVPLLSKHPGHLLDPCSASQTQGLFSFQSAQTGFPWGPPVPLSVFPSAKPHPALGHRDEALVGAREAPVPTLGPTGGRLTRHRPDLPPHTGRGARRGFVLSLSDGPESSTGQRTRCSAQAGRACGLCALTGTLSGSGFGGPHATSTRGAAVPGHGLREWSCALGTASRPSGLPLRGRAVQVARVARALSFPGRVGAAPVLTVPRCRNEASWAEGRPLAWGCTRSTNQGEIPLRTSWPCCRACPVLSGLFPGFLLDSPPGDSPGSADRLPALSRVRFRTPAAHARAPPAAPQSGSRGRWGPWLQPVFL